MESTTSLQSNIYHPLCYPKKIEANLKKELTKQIILFTIAIVCIVAVTCTIILLTNAFIKEALHITITSTGLAIPYAFSFIALGPYNKIRALQKKLKEERRLLEPGVPSYPNSEMEAKHILFKRQRLLPNKIDPVKFKKLDVSLVANYAESRAKSEFLNHLYSNPKSTASYKKTYTFHFNDYNREEVTEMTRGRLPFFTKKSEGIETKVYWNDCLSENPF